MKEQLHDVSMMLYTKRTEICLLHIIYSSQFSIDDYVDISTKIFQEQLSFLIEQKPVSDPPLPGPLRDCRWR